MSEEDRLLALLEEGEREAIQALEDLKALWAREDEATAANRAAVLEAHAQGARDRDAMRVRYGGVAEELEPASSRRAVPRSS